MTSISISERWEGLTVNGVFPLLEWLGGSVRRGVFLTVRRGTETACIKLITAAGSEADAYLSEWQVAKAMSHPDLARVLESGRCTIDGKEMVFVVTERAEAVLSGIVPRKALDSGKVRKFLEPVLNALMDLHEKGLVHGHLKPSNILRVGDQWKLSGDGLVIAGEKPKIAREPGIYDAPETVEGKFTPAADVWSLGMIVAEAFTQHVPASEGQWKEDPVVAESLEKPFLEIVRACLRVHPEQRCSVMQMKALLSQRVFAGTGACETCAPAEAVAAVTEASTTSAKSVAAEAEQAAAVAEPVVVEAAPVAVDEVVAAAPVETSATVAEPVATMTEPSVVEAELAPADGAPAVAGTEPGSAEAEPVAVEGAPAAANAAPVSTDAEPIAAVTESSTTNPESAAAPVETSASVAEPVATVTEPSVVEAESVPVDGAPAVAGTEPGSAVAEPVAGEGAPAAANAEPASTDPEPVAAVIEPSTTNPEAAAADSAPVAAEVEPVLAASEKSAAATEPTPSDPGPAAADAEPVAADTAPVAVSAEPVAPLAETIAAVSETVDAAQVPVAAVTESSTTNAEPVAAERATSETLPVAAEVEPVSAASETSAAAPEPIAAADDASTTTAKTAAAEAGPSVAVTESSAPAAEASEVAEEPAKAKAASVEPEEIPAPAASGEQRLSRWDTEAEDEAVADTIGIAPRSRLFSDDEEEEEKRGTRAWPIVLVIVLLLGIAAGYVTRGMWIGRLMHGLAGSAPAASKPVAQAPGPVTATGSQGQSQSAPGATQAAPPAETPTTSAGEDQGATTPGQAGQESQTPALNVPAVGQTEAQSSSTRASKPQGGPEATQSEQKPKDKEGAVLKQVTPNVSSKATEGMHEPVDVELRVSVNEEGNVTDASYRSPGPGNYFARIARQSVMRWKFQPPVKDGQARSSVWTVRFHFGREETDASATEVH